ncbi:dihydroneopterin aldolase [Sutterella sp.]|uniref:disulfide bond formation protein Dba n=1 Tax=Sutterella sp. TaxID=1981025 RepID=UPI0026E104D4|nr:dihydroneopterin aldolase [Sutterella sp.]MDO5531670.1 dihydroneopterin aldolase [Sutterella sp.]
MEFVEFLMLFVAVLLILMKPEKEKLAWALTIISWFVVVFMYVGHVSTAIFGMPNI